MEQWIRIACQLEVTARKPGNVHPEAAFHDLSQSDFLRAADAVAPILANSASLGIGQAVLESVEATQQIKRGNVNLGIVLLLAPLAAVPMDRSLAEGIADVLQGLTQRDADKVYQAIRISQAGGLGEVNEQDISTQPTVTLLEAMQLAAETDSVAAQYSGNFRQVIDDGVKYLVDSCKRRLSWETAIIHMQLKFLATTPDSLIARKNGIELAVTAQKKARSILDADWPDTQRSSQLLGNFDEWLRADGNRRNPGTTADLIAAALFAAFRDGRIAPPNLVSIESVQEFVGDGPDVCNSTTESETSS